MAQTITIAEKYPSQDAMPTRLPFPNPAIAYAMSPPEDG